MFGHAFKATGLVGAALFIGFLSSTAVAAGNTVTQSMSGGQSTSNFLNLGGMGNSTNGPFHQSPAAAGLPSLTQSGANAANLIELQGLDAKHIKQSFTGPQAVSNTMQGSGHHAIEQTGQNLANTVDARSIETLEQMFAGSTQSVDNTIAGYFGGSSLTQSGFNLANIANVENAATVTFQSFDETSSQVVRNQFTGKSTAGTIVQEGVNIGNYIVAHDVGRVERTFSGTQIVENTLNAGPSRNFKLISQSGLNIANYVHASGSVGEILQESTGIQHVRNEIIGRNSRRNISQSSMSIVNLTEKNGLGMNATVSQTSDTQQQQSGSSGGASQYGNVHQSSN